MVTFVANAQPKSEVAIGCAGQALIEVRPKAR